MTSARVDTGASSTKTRAIFCGGATPSQLDTIDYITIASTGDATDFGDLLAVEFNADGTSDSHGGI